MITRFPNPSGLTSSVRSQQWLASAFVLFFLIAASSLKAQLPTKTAPPHEVGFEENRGQFLNKSGNRSDDVLYVFRDKTITLYFHATGVTHTWENDAQGSAIDEATGLIVAGENNAHITIPSQTSVRMEWIGSNPGVQITGEEPLTSYTNYYLDHCPDGILNVRKFQRLVYKNIYPNTDVVYYLHDGHIKYDVILHPGARMRDVRYQYRGDHTLILDDNELKLSTRSGYLQESKPVGWNDSGEVLFSYAVDYPHSVISFTSPSIEADQPVREETTIDPVLIWGSYLGGTSVEYGYGTAIDATGNVYMTGWAQSASAVASPGAHQTSVGGSADAFLAKMNSAGALLWCTYYGGTGEDVGRDVVVDASGNVYVAGQTASNNAIGAGAGFQTTLGGGIDGFVARFTSAGVRTWGSYLGGTGNDYGRKLVVGGSSVYLMGYTASTTGVATAGSHQTTYGGGASDSFVASISDAGSLNWCSYFGGTGDEESWAGGISGGVVYLAGNTTSTSGVATPGSYQTNNAGVSDAFIAAFSTAGTFQGATYFGGSDEDIVRGFAIDGNGNMYISGQTKSLNGISTPNASQPNKAGTAADYDAFLAKFSSINTRVWSTYIGGPGNDVGRGLAIDDGNNIYQVGNTNSTTGISGGWGYQSSFGGGTNDGFFVKFYSTGERLWGSYYGNTGDDYLIAATVHGTSGRLIMVGQTTSTTGIATAGTHQSTFGGNWDAYMVVMDAVEETILYSRQSGAWSDANTWSVVGHNGPPGGVFATGTDAIIGNGHTVTLTSDDGLWTNQLGVYIEDGATLDANGFTMSVTGTLTINGSFINGSLAGSYDLWSNQPYVTVDYLNCGIEGWGGASCTLNTDVIALQGSISIDGATIDTNGHEICNAAGVPPISPVFSSPQSNAVTLSWTPGPGSAFVVVREGSTSEKPEFATTYNANAVFGSGDDLGSGNFVVYDGTGTSVTISGLSPETTYEFDLYTHTNDVGGCYTVSNYQFAMFTTCANIPAPGKLGDSEYCVGDDPPAILVDIPPSGHTISWFADATGTTPATGTVSGTYNEFFTPSASGTYYAQMVETLTGCAGSALTAVSLIQHPALFPGTPSGAATVCEGGDPAVLDGGTPSGGSGNYWYRWASSTVPGGPYMIMNDATDPTYDPPPGIIMTMYYTRTVYSGTCSATTDDIEIEVVAPPAITVQPSNQAVCADGTVTFNVTATGTALTYRWQADVGSGFSDLSDDAVYAGTATNTLQILNPTGLNNARYQCVVTSSGTCDLPSSIAVLAVNPLPSATPQVATFCETIAGSGIATLNLTLIDALIAGGVPGLTVNWFADANLTIPIAAPTAASAGNGTIFHARVSNASSCFASAGLTVTVNGRPIVTGITDVSICSGTSPSITFNSNQPGTTYTWTVNITGTIGGAADGSGSGINQTLTNSGPTAGTVTYNVTPRVNTCDGPTFSQSVDVDPIPTAYNVSGGGEVCSGSPGVAVALSNSQPGVTYSLLLNNVPTAATSTPGGGQFSFPNVTAPGTYTVRGATALGCANDMSGSAVVTVNAAPSGGTLTSADPEICVGESTTFTLSGVNGGPTSFNWTLPPGVQESSRNNNSIILTGVSESTGNISVTPVNSCGNGAALTASVVVNSAPEVAINPPSEVYALDEASFSFTSTISPVSIAWDFGDGQTSNDDEVLITYANEGTYTVTLEVIAANNCSDVASRQINVAPPIQMEDSAIKNVVTANGDGHNDVLYIDGIERFPDNEVIVMNRWGSEVYRKKGYANDWDLRKDDKYIPAGNYVCIVKYNGKVLSRTITVLKDN